MKIQGTIGCYSHPYLTLIVAGTRKRAIVTAMFDSGYSGSLCIPMSVAIPLGLMLIDKNSYKLADDRLQEDVPVFEGWILWNHSWTSINIDVFNSEEALFGVSLLALLGAKVTLDYGSKDFTVEI